MRNTIKLSVEDLPDIQGWEDGGQYEILLTLKQVSQDLEGAVFAILDAEDYTGSKHIGHRWPEMEGEDGVI